MPKPLLVKSSDHFAELWQRLAISAMQFMTVPFDLFCPIQKDLKKRQCKGCKRYFASAAAVTRQVPRPQISQGVSPLVTTIWSR